VRTGTRPRVEGTPPGKSPGFPRPLPPVRFADRRYAPERGQVVDVRLSDGYTLFVHEVGAADGLPLIVLHGGPGLDHTVVKPWLAPLGDEFRLLHVDERGQGRSERVEPATLTLEVFARDVDLLAEALGLECFALLGHSFGAIIATRHAIDVGTADAYVISGGGDSSERLLADVEASLDAMGEPGKAIADSWEWEKSVRTEEEAAELMRIQAPFHFAGEPPPDFAAETIYTPDVLRHFANEGYGGFDYTPDLGRVSKPTLVVVGAADRTTTPRAARVLHDGIPGSELAVLDGAGHMSMIEAQDAYLDAVRDFLRRFG
jgi:proline-specific peptidase